MHSTMTNIGGYITSLLALQPTRMGASQGGNVGNQNGHTFNRFANLPGGDLPLSAKGIVGLRTTIASGNSISVDVRFEDSANDSDWTHFNGGPGSSGVTTITALSTADGTNKRGTIERSVNLSGARQYVRMRIHPILTASGVDTAELSAILVTGGGVQLPADSNGSLQA